MKLKLHHINLVTDDVVRADTFYKEVMGLPPPTTGLPTLEKNRGYAGDVAFRHDGDIQLHLAQKDIHAGFNSGKTVNPVSHGHIAYRTDDLDAFKAHLEAKGVPYSNWDHAAVQGWKQIFFYDPDGNVIEVHEVSEEA